MIDNKTIIDSIEKKLMTFDTDAEVQNVGAVQQIRDQVVIASGLSKATMGELVHVGDTDTGLVLNLSEDSVSIILLTEGDNLREGTTVKTTGRLLSIGVSDQVIGRVIGPLGNPLDGKEEIKTDQLMPLEKIAAGVVERQPVDIPLKTGIKSIDAMVPIGRGQRELIIGDRGLGKTAIAIDTILSQKQTQKTDRPVICVYVAIGQKQSSVAQVVARLEAEGALSYSIVVTASASDPTSLQYLAPYAGTAVAEYFLNKGKDVLIVYDDLTKHAWAYRQLSLILRRPAGREAYPGDIFYLHSRLLERSVRLNKENGGGSITALPIIETQAGDISAYIPTNVISITDGQIFLLADLFNSGMRPALNPGNSVSRVGGAAQTGAMKSVAGKMRLELAQYRELAIFAQFDSDLDATTAKQLERGKRTNEILKQKQYQPLSEAMQVLGIWAVTQGYTDDLAVDQIQKFERHLHQYVSLHFKKLMETLSTGAKITDDVAKELKKAVEEAKKSFAA